MKTHSLKKKMLFTQTTEKMNNFPYSAVKPLFFIPLSLIFYGNLLHIQKLFVTLPQIKIQRLW